MLSNLAKLSFLFFTASILVTSCNYGEALYGITPTLKPVVTILPAEIPVLNLKTEVMQDGSSLTTAELSISPIGKGNLEVVAPTEMLLGETHIVKISITPENVLLGMATPTPKSTPQTVIEQVVATRQALEMYPLMIAELTGLNFQVLPAAPSEKVVTTNSIAEWAWAISPTAIGEQILLLSLSTPVDIGQNREIKSVMQIAAIEIKITVIPNGTATIIATDFPTATFAPTITSEPTITPTATQIPTGEQINEKLIENAGIITVAIIGFLGVALTGYLQYIAAKKNSGSKKTKK